VIKILTKKLFEKTSGFCDIIDITAKIRSELQPEKIKRGQVTLFVSGSTAALTTIEYEPGLIQDVKEFVERLIPSDRRYHHDDRWGDDNGFSTFAHRFLAHPWSFRLRIARWRSVSGSKLFCWILTTARAAGK
jgi:thiamine phosphate synthase YjbQ (UPF0047 family)